LSAAMHQKELDHSARAAIRWLQKSIEIHAGQGSAAYWHLWRSWSAPYPETTGYLIETLFDYHHLWQDEDLKKLALSCVDWLLHLQRADGAFPGGLGTQGAPIVFDTGQILLGLTRTYPETGDPRFLQAAEKAVQWLVKLWEREGGWRQAAYVPNYEPSYYTRVVWAVLYANQYLKSEAVQTTMREALQHYAARIQVSKSVQDWGFAPNEAAFTHTIAYTIRGFLESAILLNDAPILASATAIAEKLLQIRQAEGRLAGRYDEAWKGDHRFVCLTGNAQLSIVFSRLFQLTGDEKYLMEAQYLLQSALKHQWRSGALPGSSPIWGAYLPFRFPNWAAKFLLDAVYFFYEK